MRITFATAMPVTPRELRALRDARTVGRTDATGCALPASQAGTSPAMTATASATGTASAARPTDACNPIALADGRAAAAPSKPAVSPTRASSPRTVTKRRGRVQPRAASMPSSWRRARTAAAAELATNRAQMTRIRRKSTTLSRFTAERIAVATPFLPILGQR